MSNVKGGKSIDINSGKTEPVNSVNAEPSTNIDGSERNKKNPRSYPSGLGTGP